MFIHSPLKKNFNVSRPTPNTLVYGETGRYPLSVNMALKTVKFWLRVVSMSGERYTRKAYNMLFSMDEQGKETWVTTVRTFLILHGFEDVWLLQSVGDVTCFLACLKQKLIHKALSNWQVHINTSDRFIVYRNFKSVIMTETYLTVVEQKHLRDLYCRFRLGISDLLCHSKRYSTSSTMCPMCSECSENELHFLFECPAYDKLRTRYVPFSGAIGNLEENFKWLMSCTETSIIYTLARFMYCAFKLRNAT